RRRADRKREGQQRDDGERRRAKQSTNAVAQVLHRVSSEREPELIAHVVSNALDAAELHERSPSCFLGRNTRSKMFLELLVDVKLELFVEGAFDGGSRDDRANAVPTLSQLGHELLSMHRRRLPFERLKECRTSRVDGQGRRPEPCGHRFTMMRSTDR